MDENILDSIKILLGIQLDDFNFDNEIIMHINSVFMNLMQIGVGSESGFRITSKSETWGSFLNGRLDLDAVKSYVYLKVRVLFDPPQSSILLTSIEKQIAEFEWRLNVQTEPYALTAEEALEDEEEEIY